MGLIPKIKLPFSSLPYRSAVCMPRSCQHLDLPKLYNQLGSKLFTARFAKCVHQDIEKDSAFWGFTWVFFVFISFLEIWKWKNRLVRSIEKFLKIFLTSVVSNQTGPAPKCPKVKPSTTWPQRAPPNPLFNCGRLWIQPTQNLDTFGCADWNENYSNSRDPESVGCYKKLIASCNYKTFRFQNLHGNHDQHRNSCNFCGLPTRNYIQYSKWQGNKSLPEVSVSILILDKCWPNSVGKRAEAWIH